MMTSSTHLSFSIVSHGQGHLIKHLLNDLLTAHGAKFEIILTLNIPEDTGFLASFSGLPLVIIKNDEPKGFGANHNAAFAKSSGDVFVILNPDIRAPDLDLAHVLEKAQSAGVGAVAPRVLSAQGHLEDSARRFPTALKLAMRLLLRRRAPDYELAAPGLVNVDWVAGMFVAFPRTAFSSVNGFDERYFMYMEDIDICQRLGRKGWSILVDTDMSVVHDAQRASQRNLRHLSWHARSAIRYLIGI